MMTLQFLDVQINNFEIAAAKAKVEALKLAAIKEVESGKPKLEI